ncbi:MAG: hypothetical protein ACFBQW_03610 [Sphingomonadaceae bacterium]
MKRLGLAFLLLFAASCERRETPSPPPAPPPAQVGLVGFQRPMTGLYRDGRGGPASELCIVEEGRIARFGLVAWGGNDHSCSGAGRVERRGDHLLFTMEGEGFCRFTASYDGRRILLSEAPQGNCSYYCGARARFAGLDFARIGATPAAAAQATDLAGGALCFAESGS